MASASRVAASCSGTWWTSALGTLSGRSSLSGAIPRRTMSDEGHIRESGGAFGKREKALEDQYFMEQQKKQVEKLKKKHKEEIVHHEESIRRHEEAIKRHKEEIKDL